MDKESLKNIILDELLAINGDRFKPVPKRGFFAGNYLRNFSNRRGETNCLITERMVRDFLRTGARTMTIAKGAILTPLARELIDEKNVRIEHEPR